MKAVILVQEKIIFEEFLILRSDYDYDLYFYDMSPSQELELFLLVYLMLFILF